MEHPSKKLVVAIFTVLIFALHPTHVGVCCGFQSEKMYCIPFFIGVYQLLAVPAKEKTLGGFVCICFICL